MSHRPSRKPQSLDERRKLRAGIIRRVESDSAIRSFNDLTVAFNRPTARLIEALDPPTHRRLSAELARRRRPRVSFYDDAMNGGGSSRRHQSSNDEVWRLERERARQRKRADRSSTTTTTTPSKRLTLDEMKKIARVVEV
jgi:hypothetical protein